MSGWLSKLFGGAAVNFAEGMAGIIDRFVQTPEEKAEFQLALEQLMQQRDSELEQTIRAELGAKERVMVAEMQSGDTYTKRARPTLVYFGLLIIAWNHALLPTIAWALPLLVPDIVVYPPHVDLPEAFWLAWGSTVGVWSVGRSMERRGAKNNLVSLITGDRPTTKSILD